VVIAPPSEPLSAAPGWALVLPHAAARSARAARVGRFMALRWTHGARRGGYRGPAFAMGEVCGLVAPGTFDMPET